MSELTHFLKGVQERAGEKNAETGALLKEWQEAVSKLYNKILVWLKEPEEQGLVKVTRENIETIEERFGKYDVEELELFFPGNKRVIFEPKARFIVGGQGRVDVSNFQETLKLIRKSAAEGWFLVVSEFGKGTGLMLAEFDEKRFEYLLKELLK